jgi:hypothetical protein
MSAIGSVIIPLNLFLVNRLRLPAALDYARDLAPERELTEAETAERKLAEIRARAAALAAAVAAPNGELRSLGVFDEFRGR